MKGYGSCWQRPLKNTETISHIFLDLFRKDVLCAFWNVSIWCKINDCVHNPIFCIQDSNIYTLTKKFVQKLYKIYTKIIQNTKFVYNLYTKIVQIKIFYSNEYTKNVYQIPIYIYIYYIYILYMYIYIYIYIYIIYIYIYIYIKLVQSSD